MSALHGDNRTICMSVHPSVCVSVALGCSNGKWVQAGVVGNQWILMKRLIVYVYLGWGLILGIFCLLFSGFIAPGNIFYVVAKKCLRLAFLADISPIFPAILRIITKTNIRLALPFGGVSPIFHAVLCIHTCCIIASRIWKCKWHTQIKRRRLLGALTPLFSLWNPPFQKILNLPLDSHCKTLEWVQYRRFSANFRNTHF